MGGAHKQLTIWIDEGLLADLEGFADRVRRLDPLGAGEWASIAWAAREAIRRALPEMMEELGPGQLPVPPVPLRERILAALARKGGPMTLDELCGTLRTERRQRVAQAAYDARRRGEILPLRERALYEPPPARMRPGPKPVGPPPEAVAARWRKEDSIHDIAAHFGISVATVYRRLKAYQGPLKVHDRQALRERVVRLLQRKGALTTDEIVKHLFGDDRRRRSVRRVLADLLDSGEVTKPDRLRFEAAVASVT